MTITLQRPPDALHALLCAIAREVLAAHGTPTRALAPFIGEIRDAGGLMNDLIDDPTLEVRALCFLEKIGAERNLR